LKAINGVGAAVFEGPEQALRLLAQVFEVCSVKAGLWQACVKSAWCPLKSG